MWAKLPLPSWGYPKQERNPKCLHAPCLLEDMQNGQQIRTRLFSQFYSRSDYGDPHDGMYPFSTSVGPPNGRLYVVIDCVGGRSPIDWELTTGASSALVSAGRRSTSEGSTSMRSWDSSVLADGGHPGGAGTGPAAAPATGPGWRGAGPWEGLRTEDPPHHGGHSLAQPATTAAFRCGVCRLRPGRVGVVAGPRLWRPRCSCGVCGLLAF